MTAFRQLHVCLDQKMSSYLRTTFILTNMITNMIWDWVICMEVDRYFLTRSFFKGLSCGSLILNLFSCTYFHSQVLEEQFPISSTSYSNIPTMLLRSDNFPPSDVEGIRKNIDPRKLTFPRPVNLLLLDLSKLPLPCHL